MSKIKLFKAGELEDGTLRLQSQLMVGKDSADFIMKDEVVKCWGNGERGFDFYDYKEPYEIIENKKDMLTQEL
jgi:hypothetical protein